MAKTNAQDTALITRQDLVAAGGTFLVCDPTPAQAAAARAVKRMSLAEVAAAHKRITQPATSDGSGLVAYTGFAVDLAASTSSASWAVKKQFQSGSELWAGKTTFDQILDNYLSLTYT